MKDIEDDGTSILWRFPYKKGNAAKIVFTCTCGGETEIFDIKRGESVSNGSIKSESYDILIDTPIESSVCLRCKDCNQTIEIKHRAYTHEEEIEERNSKINNILEFRQYT
jgi:hypothetical protein